MPRRGLTPADVTAAAAALADAEGLPAVTLARVAADLGVRPPSLYKHVAGLEDLVGLVGVRALDALAARLSEAVAGRSGRAALVAAAHAYRDWAREHPGQAATILRAARRDRPDQMGAAARVEAVLAAALREWDLADADRVHAVRGLRAVVVGFTTIEAAGGFALATDPDVSFARLVDALVDGLTPSG